ncbi:rRNA-binding ribosome biosynthesis protein UTP23 [Spizellomyces punctatus DAOM BR117]|uniref:U three protein 23 n=1 Tax=Spizellomyces punctatus (strain DAOM BR117) TaxID=645134 RepID=A0A0L0HQQ7_SPIPD|nr:rRNA-binding ribosome biosynthesis protein UTP23 [Spizellomyces punctatus DAOM BR117]KND03285.1 hypothetical protein SPPG_02335 [Spizellomyces punctatus DAOM BR117]|eukprot:XP_016611324.1 hypothetical protein SPPG_02335 [Spizellomyces punctatus DAOM BR117]
MKVKRQKTNKRHISVYTHSFGFREPYQVLVDGNFIAVALQMRTDVRDALPKVLTGTARPMTTSCVQAELRALGPDFTGASLNAKRFERRRCAHTHSPVPAAECIRQIIGESNQHNYCVATQDQALRSDLRKIPGTPLIYINRSVVILEPPSAATMAKIQEMEIAKTLPQSFEVSILNKPEPLAPEPSKRKKKAKGPNPLSVKKKRTDAEAAGSKKAKKKKTKKKTDELEEGGEQGDTGTSVSVGEAATQKPNKMREDGPGSPSVVEVEPPQVAQEALSTLTKKRPRPLEDNDEALEGEKTVDGEPAGEKKKKKRKRRKKTKSEDS